MLVAPLMESGITGRDVYLPPGQWIDYQTGKIYAGGWQKIEAGQIPVVALVREGAAIPHMKLAQSTAQMDWSNLELVVYAANATRARGMICLPSDNVLHSVEVSKRDGNFALTANPLAGKATITVRPYAR